MLPSRILLVLLHDGLQHHRSCTLLPLTMIDSLQPEHAVHVFSVLHGGWLHQPLHMDWSNTSILRNLFHRDLSKILPVLFK